MAENTVEKGSKPIRRAARAPVKLALAREQVKPRYLEALVERWETRASATPPV